MKQKNVFRDMLLMLFFVLFSLAMIFYVIPGQIKVTPIMEKEVMNPRTMPYLASYGILIISGISFFANLAAWLRVKKISAENAAVRKPTSETLFPYFIFLLIVIYGALFYYFGILIASLIVPAIILYFLRCRKWYMYAILYAFFGIMYTIFTVVLHVPIK